MTEFVWFFLAEVQALRSEHQPLVEGSKALVQVFVPASAIEDALLRLDRFLDGEQFKRLSIRSAHRYDSTETDFDNEALSKGVEQVVSTGSASRGMMFTSQDSARWKEGQAKPAAATDWKH